MPSAFSLRLRITAVVAVVVVGTAATVTWEALRALRAELESQATERVAADAGYLATTVDHRLDADLARLRSAAGELDVGRLGDTAYLERFLSSHFAGSVDLRTRGVLLLGSDGRVLADWPRKAGRRGEFLGDRSFVREALAGSAAVIAQPVMARLTPRVPLLPMAVAVTGGRPRPAALLVGAIDPASLPFLGELMRRDAVDGVRRELIALHTGWVLASSERSRLMGRLPAPERARLAAWLRSGRRWAMAPGGGGGFETVYAVAPSRWGRWVYMQSIPRARLFAPARRLLRRLLLGGLSAALLALAAGSWLLGRVLDPLRRTTERLGALSRAAAAPQQLREGGPREIRQLLASFNRLAERLQGEHAAQQRSEARFRQLFDHAPVALATSARDGTISAMNRRFLEMFVKDGEAPRSLCAFFEHALPDAGARQRQQEELDRAWRSTPGAEHEPRPWEEQVLAGDGRQRTARLTWTPLGDAMVLMATDITDRLGIERRILDATTAEQERIGRDVHDGLGQGLTAASLMAARLGKALRRRQLEDEGNSADALETLLARLLRDARILAQGLSPLDIGPDGLLKALQTLVHTTQAASALDCSLRSEGEAASLDGVVALHLYRIAQEAISNALRHSRATSIQVRLSREHGSLTLSVRDDGVGLAGSRRGGIGLSIIGYRARSIGAHLEIRPGSHGGTCVLCRLPLAPGR